MLGDYEGTVRYQRPEYDSFALRSSEQRFYHKQAGISMVRQAIQHSRRRSAERESARKHTARNKELNGGSLDDLVGKNQKPRFLSQK